MRITDLLDKRSISLNETPKTKSEALDRIIDLMVASGKINDREAYREQVYAREEESTTGIGEGIAIPHGKCDAVTKPGLAAMVVKDGVEFDALDGQPVTLMFLIAAPNTKDNVHLDVLSKLSVLMMDEVFADALRNAKSADEFLDIIDKADAEQGDIDERLADMNEASANGFKILAVTSCPTGIAHTYMAAEGIEKAAKEKDCFVKIETRGSGGAKNVLTEKEIKEADCIIVAADAQVPMDRFDGKKVIICQVSDGISKAPQLIDQAMSGNVPVYHSGNETSSSTAVSSSGKSGGIGHKIYTQLMNGVSHMLPFVVGGGILIAIAFLIDGLSIDLNSLPADERAAFGTITPAAALFKQIGGVAFGFMLPVLAGYVEHRIQLGFRCFERIDDQHSFSGGQSVGFQHVRRFQRFEKGFGFVGVFLRETTVGGRRNTVADHEILGEILTPFEPRPDRRRADHGDVADLMVFLEKIVNPFYQRFFRADDDHVDVVRQHELFDGREIDRIDVHVRPAYGGACVPRSDIQPRQPLALSDFPCKGMFTAP